MVSVSQDLSDRVINGVAWVTLGRIGERALHFLFSIILARLLFPEDFGTIAIVTVFFGFGDIIASSGMGASIVQLPEVKEEHLQSSFWTTFTMSCSLTIFLFLGAPLIAEFYQIPILITLARALSFTFIISSFQRVPWSILQRNMEFGKLSFIQVVGLLLSGTFGITLAYLGFGVWSLVAQSLLGGFVGSILMMLMTKWYPKFMFSWQALRDIWGFSLNFFGAQSLAYWARNIDNLMIGFVFNASILGYYIRSYALLLLPLTQLVGIIQVVMFPALSSIQDDKARVKRIYLRSLSIIAIAVFPMMLGLAVVAEPFVITIYGERWRGMITMIKFLSVISVFQSLVKPTDWLFMSLGRADLMLRWRIIQTSLEVIGFLVGIWLGTIEAFILCYMLITLIIFYPNIMVGGQLVNLKFYELINVIYLPLIGSTLMVIGVMFVQNFIRVNYTAELITLTLVGIFIYGIFILLTKPSGWQELIDIMKKRIPKRQLL